MFVYSQWENFCKRLDQIGRNSITATDALKRKDGRPFLILKHDIETNPTKALKLAQIESKYSHRGSYYVQAYLLNKRKHIRILKKVHDLGHEVSYHHDVMDSNKGHIDKAAVEFRKYVSKFEEHGFTIETVCQHGNPVMERKGYFSNRDFFRNTQVAETFNDITEIMVNFKSRLGRDYMYISDAGYGWKWIHDPENNDREDTSHLDQRFENLEEILRMIQAQEAVIVSTHPHRWYSHFVLAKTKEISFRGIKSVARIVLKLPFMKKLLARFYYLAKKI
ncbi:hypothetical protein [Cohnella caldifontis]|uniref:hypothetical protein n=1 Tax=Cohnella caldifontis TaxID=3027471 RepID=UPI0023EAC9BF|nr:hypothetical protein [Cohnella sp. YIM B05605]